MKQTTTISDSDRMYMQRCIQLALCGEMGAAPNPMVGALLVCDGLIVGEGFHVRCGGPHAEVNAIASVRDKGLLRRSTLYVSLEPCAHYGKTPPCADLIIEMGIPRVVVGCQDPFAKVNGLGISKLRDAGVDVKVGVLEAECLRLNRRFMTFHQKQRPWVTLKWAQSSDGYIDGKREQGGRPARLSSRYTSVLVHRLRAQCNAIMVGTNTVLLDNPTLNTRLWPGGSPLRVTIDRRHRLPGNLNILDGSAPTIVYETGSLGEILADLYGRNVQSLLVEGGARLIGSFMDEGLWDEARVETSPENLGAGVEAPRMCGGTLVSEEHVDGRTIQTFVHDM